VNHINKKTVEERLQTLVEAGIVTKRHKLASKYRRNNVRVRVLKRSDKQNMGDYLITTFPVDEDGTVVDRTSPAVSHWRATWAPATGKAHAHAPVYRRGRSLDFETEDKALDGCKRAIREHFVQGNRLAVDIVLA
jgi:hypothetical protein